MFNNPLPFKLVQVKSNKYRSTESHSDEMVFRFYRHNEKCCIKYIVSVKNYDHLLLTLDFYPKINLSLKGYSSNSTQGLRYRMLTRQNSFGYIGGTILNIMHYVQEQTNIYTWGFLAANLPNELTNYNNKRFNIYKEILRRTFIHQQTVFGNKDKSAIFVIPNNQLINKDLIATNYEKIFSETN